MDKNYRLTEPYSNGVKDKCPDWMHEILNIKKETLSESSVNEIGNIFSNVQSSNKTCPKCGSKLSTREVSICKNCINK